MLSIVVHIDSVQVFRSLDLRALLVSKKETNDDHRYNDNVDNGGAQHLQITNPISPGRKLRSHCVTILPPSARELGRQPTDAGCHTNVR